MRLLGSFIDCVYESHLYKQNLREIANKLIDRLPDRRICALASVLIIDTKYDMYAVKIRWCVTKEDGSIDVEKIHKRIMESDFIEISKEDYLPMDDLMNITRKTDKLIGFGKNVIFRMKNLDVDTLI